MITDYGNYSQSKHPVSSHSITLFSFRPQAIALLCVITINNKSAVAGPQTRLGD
jgi:hypothetical protein